MFVYRIVHNVYCISSYSRGSYVSHGAQKLYHDIRIRCVLSLNVLTQQVNVDNYCTCQNFCLLHF